MEKKNKKKGLKGLIIAAIALVLVAAVGVTLWLTLGKKGNEADATAGMKIYWNVERDQYVAKGSQGVSARFPRDDGNFYVRFAVDGKQVDLPVDNIEVVTQVDNLDYMGLEFDENGVVIGVVPVEEFTGGLAADR